LVLGLYYVKGREEGHCNEDCSEKGCGGGYVVSRLAYESRIYGFCTGRWASFVVWDLAAKKGLLEGLGLRERPSSTVEANTIVGSRVVALGVPHARG
jgi:hypothetical protein